MVGLFTCQAVVLLHHQTGHRSRRAGLHEYDITRRLLKWVIDLTLAINLDKALLIFLPGCSSIPQSSQFTMCRRLVHRRYISGPKRAQNAIRFLLAFLHSSTHMHIRHVDPVIDSAFWCRLV